MMKVYGMYCFSDLLHFVRKNLRIIEGNDSFREISSG